MQPYARRAAGGRTHCSFEPLGRLIGHEERNVPHADVRPLPLADADAVVVMELPVVGVERVRALEERAKVLRAFGMLLLFSVYWYVDMAFIIKQLVTRA